MKDLRDKQLTTLFGKLSNEEAPVDKNSWEHIKTNINKPGHSSLGASQIKAIIFGLAVIITGASIWLFQKDTEDLRETESQQMMPHKNNQTAASNEKKEHTVTKTTPPSQSYNPTRLNTSSSNSTATFPNTSEELATANDIEQTAVTSLPDTTKSDSTYKQIVQTATEKSLLNNTPIDSSKKVMKKDSATVQGSPAKKASKKIIIVEEDTVVQVDTVFKKKRFRKKDD